MSLRSIILTEIEHIAAEQKCKLMPLTDELPLLESGLDSLSWAILVARLEEILGVDPLTASTEAYYPITVGDFIRVYETAKVSG